MTTSLRFSAALGGLVVATLVGAGSAGAAPVQSPSAAQAAPADRIPVSHSAGPTTDLQPDVDDPTDGTRATLTVLRWPGGTFVLLRLRGFAQEARGTSLGAHVHVGDCVAGDGVAAGPHYNRDVATGRTPVRISDRTEIWLDFTVNRHGRAQAVAVVPWRLGSNAAGAVVVHAEPTDPATGSAGARLACRPLDL